MSEITLNYASPVDLDAYGRYRPGGRPGLRYPFQGRITDDGTGEFPAEPGRYHLYVAAVCPYAQRAAIVRSLKGLQDVVSLSYVDDDRDGRGWAFRERRGADPVNGFATLRQAYEATEPGFDGHVSVPVLWDRRAGLIVSNNFPDITLDLGARFGGDPEVDLYPEELRPDIDALNARIYEYANTAAGRVASATTEAGYHEARRPVIAFLEELDARLAGRRFLFGSAITESDVRLWPTLLRFDLSDNPAARISERPLTAFPNLWAYARDLYQHPAFRGNTDFSALSVPDGETDPWRIPVEPSHADWNQPHRRAAL
ncbi:glutathione S-transferase C-terminal domain-containing protein [Streptosporangium sp. NPDC051022]|uniref:glutathione S-transferase C-terminal domain-containing protein n=1 Tax=Streptosporangium sp. NPDC051022 TaxID=3155752 RepID=UPI0034193202